jgi:predicted Fe-Mo cluster-binding NifX family protein
MTYVIIPRVSKWNIATPASKVFDRKIAFRKGEEFAIVCSMFYGRIESKHRTAKAVIDKCRELEKAGYKMYTILHVTGVELVIVNGVLQQRRY